MFSIMAGLYIKLDHDWQRDDKVRNMRITLGKGCLIDIVQLFIALSRGKGRIDVSNPGQAEGLYDTLGMTEKRALRFLDVAAECGLINRELWEQGRIVTSERATKDARAMSKASEVSAARAEAGRRSGESRRANKQPNKTREQTAEQNDEQKTNNY